MSSRKYKFLVEHQESTSLKLINVRVSEELYNRFSAAKQVAEKNGFTLVMTEIVRNAISDACSEVEKAFKVDLSQQALPLEGASRKTPQEPFAAPKKGQESK